MVKMTLKLERDQARAVRTNFFIYLVQLCNTRVKDSRNDVDVNLSCLVVRSIFQEVVKIFDRKLLTESNRFSFAFTEAQGIVLYGLLLEMPIERHQVWLCNLRQLIIDTLHGQLSEPPRDQERGRIPHAHYESDHGTVDIVGLDPNEWHL